MHKLPQSFVFSSRDIKLIQECSIVPQNYKRYRDNTTDVCRNSSQEEQKCITDWMNENTEKDKIKFSIECIGEVKFLDTCCKYQ